MKNIKVFDVVELNNNERGTILNPGLDLNPGRKSGKLLSHGQLPPCYDFFILCVCLKKYRITQGTFATFILIILSTVSPYTNQS